MGGRLNLIISRRRKTQQHGAELEQQLAEMLSGRDALHVALVPHLYDLAPDGPVVRHLRALEGHMAVVAWLYPRAAYWVLQANGIIGRMGKTASFPVEEMESATVIDSADEMQPGTVADAVEESDTFEKVEPGPVADGSRSGSAQEQPVADTSGRAANGNVAQASRTIWCFDMRRYDTAEALVAELGEIVTQATGKALGPVDSAALAAAERLLALEEDTRLRWYPVVDYSRCGNCLECLNFCLFGVFGLSDGRLVVEEPDACRPGCPACARVCPSQAIMFPQHGEAFIAGDPTASPQAPDAESLKQLGLNIVTPAMLQPGTMATAERARALLEKAVGPNALSESRDGTTAAAPGAASKTPSTQPSDSTVGPSTKSTVGPSAKNQPAGDAPAKLSRLVDDLEQADL